MGNPLHFILPTATGRLTNWVLSAAITYAAPASRVMVPSSNTVITSSSQRIQIPIILDFSSEEGRRAAHQWYEKQGSNTRFTSLEYRKDREGQFRHEFIVVRLDDTTLCRFDRRAREDRRGHALRDEGTITEDTAHVIYSYQTEYEELVKESEILLTISFPDGEDLKLILAVCFGIQAHPRAASYSLLRYNCYFFSWTIITTVARHAVKWEDVMTSGIVQGAVREMANGHTHTHTTPSHSIRARIRNWFTRPTRRYTSIRSYEQNIEDFWSTFEFYLSEEHFWDLGPILQKVLLRSQLDSVLAKGARRFVKAIWLGVMCSYAEGYIRRLVSREFRRELSHYTLAGHNYVEELAMMICCTAAETMLKHDDERNSKNGPGGFFPINDDAWDYAGRKHHAELLSLHRSATATQTKSSGPSLTTEKFGIEVKKIGERILQGIGEKYAQLAFEQSAVFAKYVTAALLKNLVDIDPKQVTFANINHEKHMIHVLEHPPLHRYIGQRMQDHFKMVESFGFGNFKELLATAEESMCGIWVTTIDVLDRDISNWPLSPPRRQDPGLLVPPWLLGFGHRIRPVLRFILVLAHVCARVVKFAFMLVMRVPGTVGAIKSIFEVMYTLIAQVPKPILVLVLVLVLLISVYLPVFVSVPILALFLLVCIIMYLYVCLSLMYLFSVRK